MSEAMNFFSLQDLASGEKVKPVAKAKGKAKKKS